MQCPRDGSEHRGADDSVQDTSETNLTSKVLVLPSLAWFLCESSFSGLAGANRWLWGQLHSRECFRPLVMALPPLPEGQALRRRIWHRLLLGAMELAVEGHRFEDLSQRPSEADAEIQRDVGRTFPERFDEATQQALFRVLRAVSHRVEDIGYCQGMNFIAGVMLCVFRSCATSTALQAAEPFAYHCVLSMLLRHGMNQYFGAGFPKLRLSALQFDCLLEAYLPDLSAFFNRFNISAEFYATQWFLTLFAYSLPFPHLLRVWDQFLCRGMKFIHRVGLALLKEARADLLGKGFDATIERLRCLCQRSQLSPEALVASAMEFKVTNRFLSDLEQAITSPSGAARLPSCFLERDLDRGRTQCRFLLNTDGGSEAPVLTGQDLTFWEASLPPPRVPSDPLTPGLSLEPPGDPKEKSKAKSQLKSFARKSQKVLSKVKTPVVLSMRSSGKSAKHEAPAQSLSDSERKEKSHHRSSSVPSHRGYQRCGAAAAASAWDVPMIPSPSAKTTARQWMPSLRSGRKQSPNGRSF